MERRSKRLGAWTLPFAACVVALAGAGGCAVEQKTVEKELANPRPIDCRTAPGDLRVLRQEKANIAERIAEGVTSIYPAGLVIGLVTGTEETKLKVATGEYNKMIDARIAEIESTCGL